MKIKTISAELFSYVDIKYLRIKFLIIMKIFEIIESKYCMLKELIYKIYVTLHNFAKNISMYKGSIEENKKKFYFN